MIKRLFATAAVISLLSGAAHADAVGVPTGLSWYSGTSYPAGTWVNVAGSWLQLPQSSDPVGMGGSLMSVLAQAQICAHWVASNGIITNIFVPLPANITCPP
jgi:uncharacterized membrane protein AbrB (regulator of aidB expression)